MSRQANFFFSGIILLVIVNGVQANLSFAKTTYNDDPLKIPWYQLHHVTPGGSGVVISVEAVNSALLPYEPMRLRIRLTNPTKNQIGPLPHPGLHARINGSMSPDKSTYGYRTDVVPAIGSPSLMKGSYFTAPHSRLTGVWLQPGETATFSLTFTSTKPAILHAQPGKHSYRVRYGSMTPPRSAAIC